MAKGGNWWYWTMVFMTRRLVFPLLGRVRVEGVENVPMEGPVLIAPVHVSYLDPPLLGCTCPRAVRFMAKEELFKGVLGWLIASVQAFPVKRGGNDTGAIRFAMGTLKNGEALLMFPEGTRGDGKHLSPLQSGVLMMAKKSHARIVPVGLGGTYSNWPKGVKKPKRGPMHVVYGESFTYEEVVPEGYEGDVRELFEAEVSRRLLEVSARAGMVLSLPATSGESG